MKVIKLMFQCGTEGINLSIKIYDDHQDDRDVNGVKEIFTSTPSNQIDVQQVDQLLIFAKKNYYLHQIINFMP